MVVLGITLAAATAIFVGTRRQATSPDESLPKIREDGSLTATPRPLSLDDVAQAGVDTPSGAVLRLWYWSQWGAFPNVVAAYHPGVVRKVGDEVITRAYGIRRGEMIASRPRILEAIAGRSATLVTVEALRKNLPPQRFAFTLRATHGRWHVLFDTLLEAGIAPRPFRTGFLPDSVSSPPR